MKTSKHTNLACKTSTAFFFFLFIGSAFTFIGCTQLYKIIGLSPDQIADQTTKDQKSRQKIIDTVRIDLTQLITTIIAGLGTTASGFLAKWLGTERKITKVLITGIESTNTVEAKKAVYKKALSAGIEPQLHARVRTLT